jgi:hypothetical protein
MTSSLLQFKIAQLRQERTTVVNASIAVFVFLLFTVALLPNLLVNYYYANQNLTEAPALLNQIPLAVFVIGMADFLFTLVTFFRLGAKAKSLEKELDSMAIMDASCCANGCNCDGECTCDDDCNCADCHENMISVTTEDTAALAGALSKKAKAKKATKARRK